MSPKDRVGLRLTRALLVIAILLPKFLSQFRIGFLHCRFTQLARDNVIVAAIGNVSSPGPRPPPPPTSPAATDPTAAASISIPTVTLTLTISSSLLAVALSTGPLSVLPGACGP